MKHLLIAVLLPLLAIFIVFFAFWYVVSFIVMHFKGRRVRYSAYGYTTFFFCFIWLALLFYGYKYGRWNLEVVDWHFVDKQLPREFDGYRIVHISDLHLEGFTDNPSYVDTVVKKVNSLNPDLICFTGDIVSFSHDGLLPFVEKLKKLNAKDGVISILGNHDYGIYESSFDSIARENDNLKLIQIEREQLNWQLLLNQNCTIKKCNDSIVFIGSENQACGFRQKVRRGNLSKAMKGISSKDYKILLTHDPSHWDSEVIEKTDIRLTLSGHTHAMQFSVLGWTPCRIFFNRSDGPYHVGEQSLYVNRGLGELIPFRIGATPEITLITLCSK